VLGRATVCEEDKDWEPGPLMRRSEFISLMSGVTTAWPLAAVSSSVTARNWLQKAAGAHWATCLGPAWSPVSPLLPGPRAIPGTLQTILADFLRGSRGLQGANHHILLISAAVGRLFIDAPVRAGEFNSKSQEACGYAAEEA
jgi:hypothetical protein